MTKTVAIIGAGVSGLTAMKACLEEDLQPTAFELRDEIGGIWNYDPDTSDGTTSRIFKNLVTNTSKILGVYSDFPFPEDTPPFVKHQTMLKYLNDYADHFKLRKHIQFNTEVVKIEKADDYDTTGRWSVSTRQRGQDVVTTIYDYVMICTGAFTEPFTPSVPGMEQFEGDILHAYQYRVSDPFADKNVLVVGGSFSAADVAVEVCNAAKQLYMSVRHGFWVFGRLGPGGLPYDTFVLRRIAMTYFPRLGAYLYQNFIQRATDYDAIGIEPDRNVFQESFAINDFLFPQINCGKVKIVPGIKRFMRNGVELTDGTRLDLDTVVYGTGYNCKTSFIDDDLISDDVNTRDLYKYTFPINLRHPTLAGIMLLSTVTSALPLAEQQSRWAVRVFQGKNKLPPKQEMKDDITRKAEGLCALYGRPKHLVPAVPLADEIAGEMGCYPSLKWLFLRDPRLALQVFLGPITPFTYRLLGPHPWPGARDAVMTCWDACFSAYPNRGSKVKKQSSWLPRTLMLMALAMVIVAAVYSYDN